uniref:Uncharacterized protein n=1 Tax=Arundo donax TaxID=35708 RepID=A0A0A9H256_ARUDO
MCQTLHRKL